MHIYMCTYICTLKLSFSLLGCTDIQMQTDKHTLSLSLFLSLSLSLSLAFSCSLSLFHSLSRSLALSLSLSHTHTHTRTHTQVQNLRTLFPDRQLKFRPLDSFKLDLVTIVTFVSIAVTKLRFDDTFTDIVALVRFYMSHKCMSLCVYFCVERIYINGVVYLYMHHMYTPYVRIYTIIYMCGIHHIYVCTQFMYMYMHQKL